MEERMTGRTFELKTATRERVPLIVALAGPSGGGKTYSALRLATGMQRVIGGEIACIDTESRRALHYADSFKFQHMAFGAPFSPLDYLDAIAECTRKGASIVVIDSLSHEHDGPGGVLEWHDAEVERLSKAWGVKPGKAQIPAWSEPKKARRKLIQTDLQLGVNLIICMRAKEKIGLKGDKVIDMGWSPIGGEEFVFEATLSCLLLPGSGGVPTWNPERPGEKAMTKLPEQFRAVFAQSIPLSEDIGAQLAKWAAGDGASLPPPAKMADVIEEIRKSPTIEAVKAVAAKYRGGAWTPEQKTEIKQEIDAQIAALAEAAKEE